ncbi:hypothetical protein [Phytohabitans kaempferiae]|uniref:Integral membrane protein n=1 Tax=Phytohabitans kaempferiae TaxID=1620943 RepID=A0ABV6MF79_9ACTN
MIERNDPSTPILASAAVVAGLTAVTLIVLGFWLHGWVPASDGPRFTDPGWWLGVFSQIGGYLVLGKSGFKIGLAVVLGVTGLAVWLRERHRKRLDTKPATPEDDTDEPR